jgi:hypothetical protein
MEACVDVPAPNSRGSIEFCNVARIEAAYADSAQKQQSHRKGVSSGPFGLPNQITIWI